MNKIPIFDPISLFVCWQTVCNQFCIKPVNIAHSTIRILNTKSSSSDFPINSSAVCITTNYTKYQITFDEHCSSNCYGFGLFYGFDLTILIESKVFSQFRLLYSYVNYIYLLEIQFQKTFHIYNHNSYRKL